MSLGIFAGRREKKSGGRRVGMLGMVGIVRENAGNCIQAMGDGRGSPARLVDRLIYQGVRD